MIVEELTEQNKTAQNRLPYIKKNLACGKGGVQANGEKNIL